MEPEEFRRHARRYAIIGAFFGLALVFYALGWRGALEAYVLVLSAVAVLAILVQSGKGGGLAASLGGFGGESLLGARSATPIARATYVMLVLFIFMAMLLARLGPLPAQAAPLEFPEENVPTLPAPDFGPGAPAERPGAAPASPATTAPAAAAPAAPAQPGQSAPSQPSGPAAND